MKKLIVILLLTILFQVPSFSQSDSLHIDTLEFQIGYPHSTQSSAITQLRSYPSPRYFPNTNFIRLFDWMNPDYLGGSGQNDIKTKDIIKNAVEMQKELAFYWNYSFVIQNTIMAYSETAYTDANNSIGAYTDLANKYPQIPLGVITLWTQMNPIVFGYKNRHPNVISMNLPSEVYINDTLKKLKNKKLSFAAPDSLFIADGKIQKMYLKNIINHLTRPIDIINENGEEPPSIIQQPAAIAEKIMSMDKQINDEKNKMNVNSWHDYISIKKKHFRKLYSSQFMDSIPELKKTSFTYYQIDGGPSAYQFDWNILKSVNTKINGNYYSTPDLYPRYPQNWMMTQGPWHGWNWIEISRKTEIKSGDTFFSPFIAAGWSYNPEFDIRPAQWLGLLKCLSVVGAEFFYTGYFNLNKPFSKTENYIWQAAIPAYAQAVTTRYADLFRNGNVLLDKKGEPIITYPKVKNSKDILIAVRKHNDKKEYVIAATVQTLSNTIRTPLQKEVIINIDGENIKLLARRQGSVYIYDKTVEPPIFYQLDRWHESTHPERWRKSWINEAEVFDSASVQSNQLIKSIYTKEADTTVFINSISYILLNKNQWVNYSIYNRDLEHLKPNKYIYMLVKSSSEIKFTFAFNDNKINIQNKEANSWTWIKYDLPATADQSKEINLIHIQSQMKNLLIDKIVISDSPEIPDLKEY